MNGNQPDGATKPPQKVPAKGHALLRAAKLMGGLALAVVLAVSLLLAGLQSEPVRRMLLGALTDALASGPGWRIDVGGMEGFWPFRMRLSNIRLADKHGEWLFIPETTVTLRPWPRPDGLQGLEVLLHEARMSRIPASDAASQPSHPLAFLDALESIPLPFSARFEADSLHLDQPVAGRPLDVRASVTVRNTPAVLDLRAGCARMDGPSTSMDIQALFEPLTRSACLRLAIDEVPGGMIAELAGLAGESSLSVLLDGAGPLSSWEARLEAARAGEEILHATVNASLGRSSAEDARFALDLSVRPATLPLSGQVRAALGEQLGITLKGGLTSAGLPSPQWKILIDDSSVTTAAGTAGLRGDAGAGCLFPRMSFRAALSNPSALGLTMGPLEVHGNLEADIDPAGPLSARADVEAPDVAATLEPLGVQLGGLCRFQAMLSGDTAKKDLSLSLEGGLFGISPGKGATWVELAAALGSEVTMQAKARMDSQNMLTLGRSTISAKSFSAEAAGTFGLTSRNIELGLGLEVADLSLLSGLAGKPLAGSLAGHSQIKGEASTAHLSVKLEGSRLAVAAARFDAAGLDAEATLSADGSHGRLSASVSRPRGRLGFETRFSLARDRLGLSGLKMSGPGVDVSGELDVSLADSSAAGRLKAGLDLNRLGTFLDLAMSGTAKADSVLTQSRGRQDVSLTASAAGLDGFGLRVRKAELSGAFTDVARAPQGQLAASVEGMRLDGSTVDTLSFQASGSGKEVAFTARAKGALPEPFEARSAGTFVPSPGGGRLGVNDLRVAAYGTHLILTRPATLTFGPGSFALPGVSLALGPGRITASGDWKQTGVDLTAEMEGIPLDLLRRASVLDISGSASARVRISGTPPKPRVTASLNISQVRLGGGPDQAVPLLQGTASAEYSGERLVSQATLSTGKGLNLEGRMASPARLSLLPMEFSLPRAGALEATLRGTAELSTLAAFFNQEDLIVQGALKVDLAARGRLNAPEISGQAGIEHGTFENAVSGTVLRNIVLRAEADGARIVIQEFSATDGLKGTVSGLGQIEIAPEKKFPLAVEITLERAALARTDMVAAMMSGRMAVSGNASALTVRGRLSAGPVEVTIPDRLPPDVVPVEIEMVNVPKAEQAEAGTVAPSGPGIPVLLDIDVDFPDRIFVRGLGLDSVWNGQLHVGGSALSPAIAGDIGVVRGRVDFFGKQFTLVKGVVSFTGESPPVPKLDMDAQIQRSGITADILVTGSTAQPAVAFTSVPPLPRDEILSRVLFGQSVSGLTAPQALQLAQAAGSLLGQGNALDLLGKTRKLAGLDYLGIGSKGTGTEQSSLVAGKYITDKIYVETGQGLGGQSGTVSVEVELTPNLTLDSTTGMDSKTGVGLNWKMEY